MSYLSRLEEEPFRYDMLDLMRRIERTLGRPMPMPVSPFGVNGSGLARAEPTGPRPRIGDSAARKDETIFVDGREMEVSFGQDPWMEFPASNLRELERRPKKRPEQLTGGVAEEFERDVEEPPPNRLHFVVKFLGLLGAQGALPMTTTEEVQGWRLDRDDSFVHFADIFNNRFLQLFFRIWADARPIVQHDRPDCDRFDAYVRSVIGVGSPAFAGLKAVPPAVALYAGLLGPQAKSASRLRNAIRGIFGVDAIIEQFVGTWLDFDEEERSLLGARNSGLGTDLLVGKSCFSVQDKIRIRIYVNDLGQYQRFLPQGDYAEPLVDLIFFYIGDELEWDVELALPARCIVPMRLGEAGALGWTTWASPNYAPDEFRCDARFNLAERVRNRRQQKA